MTAFTTFRDAYIARLPRWLRKGSIGKLVYTLGVHADVVAQAAYEAVRKRAAEPNSEDAASYIAAERRIIRGKNETWDNYSARVANYHQDHKRRGNPYVLLEQLYAYWQGAFPISLYYQGHNKMGFDLATDGTITRGRGDWWLTGDDSAWAQWLLVYYWPDPIATDGLWGDPGLWGDGGIWGVGLGPSEIEDLRAVPRNWGNAHSIGRLRLVDPVDSGIYIDIPIGRS